jgi:hypothetical protein
MRIYMNTCYICEIAFLFRCKYRKSVVQYRENFTHVKEGKKGRKKFRDQL